MKAYEIFGAEGKGEEFSARKLMSRLFDKKNPELLKAVACVGLNPHRSSQRECDLILLISWNSSKREMYSTKPLDDIDVFEYESKGNTKCPYGEQIRLDNAVLTIEIKDHSPEGILIIGSDLYVKYPDKNECVTAKLLGQASTAKNFLKSNCGINAHVGPFIYLSNVNTSQLRNIPDELLNVILFNDTTYEELLSKIIKRIGIAKALNGKLYLGLSSNNILSNNGKYEGIKKYYIQLKPTSLEQERMEILGKKFVDRNKKVWSQKLGNTMVAFTGRAGTGKTLKLLRTARDLTEENMDNVLLLTFNKALARDLQRLMQLQKISTGTAISILTIDQLLYGLAKNIGIIDNNKADNNDAYYKEIRELLSEAVKQHENLMKMKDYLKDYSMVAIDEAQDWFEEERTIILHLFDPKNVIIAAGTDQCLRSPKIANWKGDVKAMGQNVEIVRDNMALRQTKNLSLFSNILAREMGLDWTVEPNEEALGGQIFLFETLTSSVLSVLLEEYNNQQDKVNGMYALIDFMLLMSASRKNREKVDKVHDLLEKQNYPVWDAITEKDRGSVPERNKLRCVSLESCRGLEGWSTVIMDIDRWYDFAMEKEKERNVNLQFAGLEDLPTWFLIPFTRAKYRMLIEMPKKEDLRRVFERIQEKYSDIVQYVR